MRRKAAMRRAGSKTRTIALLILYVVASMLPAWSERITFSANSMTGTAGNTSDTTTLSGSAYVLTSSMEIAADCFHLQARHRKKLPKAEGQRLADTAHIVGYRLLTPFLHSGISLLPYSYFHIVI